MALTPEQQNQLDFQKEQSKIDTIQKKLDLVRIAKDVLTENDRNKPVGERGVTAQDITTMAETLKTYIYS